MFGSEKAELQQRVSNLLEQVDDLQGQLRDAQRGEALAQSAVAQAGDIAIRVGELIDQGNIPEAAGSIAMQHCFEEERRRLMSEATEHLIGKHGEQWRAQYRTEHGAEVAAQVDEGLRGTGAYESIEARTAKEVRENIRQARLDEMETAARAKLDTPQAQEELKAQVAAELEASGEAERIQQAVQAELEQRWRPEALETIKAEVAAEVAAGEAGFKQEAQRTWRNSYHGEQFIHGVRSRLQNEWREAGTHELQLAIEDEEFITLIDTMLAKEKERLRREIKATELLTAFEGRGLAVNELEPDTQLTIYLGTAIAAEKVMVEPAPGYSIREDTKVVMRYGRMLRLVAIGDGKFTVNHDSLSESKSQYERAAAIHQGAVIVIGRRQVENGSEELKPYVSAGVELHYDADTTDPAINSSLLPALNVEVDGLAARPFDAKTSDTTGIKQVIKLKQ